MGPGLESQKGAWNREREENLFVLRLWRLLMKPGRLRSTDLWDERVVQYLEPLPPHIPNSGAPLRGQLVLHHLFQLSQHLNLTHLMHFYHTLPTRNQKNIYYAFKSSDKNHRPSYRKILIFYAACRKIQALQKTLLANSLKSGYFLKVLCLFSKTFSK